MVNPALEAALANPSKLRQALEAEQGRRHLRHFMRYAWDVVEPSRPYIANWHMDAIADHLEAVTKGEIDNLIITVPPGHAKSLTVSVFWQPWIWLANPGWRSLFASYDSDLSIRDSVRSRSLLDSPWYRDTFQPKWNLSSDQNVKSHYENDQRGFRISLSVRGAGTGYRGDCIVVDDPLNAKQAHSERALAEVIVWWDQVMSSRLNNMAKGHKVIIMQRLSDNDLVGHVLRRDNYEHLNLPTRFEEKRRTTTSIGFTDPRTEEGELLFPQLFPKAVVDNAEKILGSFGFAAQHQQRPTPAEGGIFKKEWWRRIRRDALPAKFDRIIQSWDCSFKDKAKSDLVCGGVWGQLGANKYLIDIKNERMSFTKTISAIRAMKAKWPDTGAILIEDKANGTAAIDTLKNEISGLIPIEPEGGKEVRAHAISPQVEAGNVYIVDGELWANNFIESATSFPFGANDDDIDQMTQALFWMEHRRPLYNSLNLISVGKEGGSAWRS